MLITAIPDSVERSVTAEAPKLSSVIDPSTADLVLLAAHLRDIAWNCNVSAKANEPNNPYAAIGALTILTSQLHTYLQARLADEERSLLLMQRLRHEEAQERAHEQLLATDSDYAAEWDDLDGDDQ